jgi:DNA invertase Pin-like site-specific DNA recombinase
VSRGTIRCAIYTRKSSDEGLDQSFNSLDAQREAGEAYVKSQAHEGWKALPALYDDGGYSGGTMERPGLQRLLTDIDAGLVDVVVVYKIDRLTRSLADFARIVERFDARDVSFVSVTQAFNTTSSMGRLTLNVLLSFAQFEREVTGERIRDKIAASKAKGMWMGGNPPLGYDLPASGTRILRVNEGEAETVRHIFARYLELGSVHALQRELTDQGIVSKRRVTGSGRAVGGLPFSRGALFHLLRSPIYLGRIPHKGVIHEGGHEPIVEQGLFDEVQERLDHQARRHRNNGEQGVARAALVGRLFDASGSPMSPTFSRGKSGRLYRYYVSAPLQQGERHKADDAIRRLPAPAFEKLLAGLVERWVPLADVPLDLPLQVRLHDHGFLVDMPGELAPDIAPRLRDDERIVHATRQSCWIEVLQVLPLRGGKRSIVTGSRAASPDPSLIRALRKAHRMLSMHRGLPALEKAPASRYDRQILRLAFLAPDLQRDILTGHQPPALTLEELRCADIPPCWNEQRRALGWPASA